MERTEIVSLFKNTPADGTEITVCGWAKNIRDSKNIGFIALSDGGCFKTLQVVLEAGKLENYEDTSNLWQAKTKRLFASKWMFDCGLMPDNFWRDVIWHSVIDHLKAPRFI